MIILYMCSACNHVFDQEMARTEKHAFCECGNGIYRQVNPTRTNVIKYVLGHPLYAIKKILAKETSHE